MTDDERQGFRALFDATMRFMQHGEAHIAALECMPSNDVRDALLLSTRAHLIELRKQANALEKLGLFQ